MESQPLHHLFFVIIWMFVFFLHPVHLQQDLPTLSLDSRVFVALKGNDLSIDCKVKKPANQSKDTLNCFDPDQNQIYSRSIMSTAGKAETRHLKLMLKHVNASGEYHCQYRAAKVYWFLYVRDKDFKHHAKQDYTDFILVTIFTVVLLIFSVVGSVYVFRGHWISTCRQTDQEENKYKEDKEKGSDMRDDSINAVTDPSTSFYAVRTFPPISTQSLEPRTRSIYEELHPSPANKKTEQQKANPKKPETHQKKQRNTPDQDEGQFESVYENY